MPEGPEIRRAADQVESAIVNKILIKLFFGQDHLKHWEPRFISAKVKRVETYGKAMLTRFDNGLNIYSHNQLYGRWYICPYSQYPDSKRQLRLAIHTKDLSALLYSASEIEVLADDEIVNHHFISKLGIDVLAKTTTKEMVLNCLKSRQFFNRQLSGFLTDQSFVAGLGNYLRCEILFVVGLNPKIKPSQLSNSQLEQLAQTILELPQQSYQTAGITNDLKRAKSLMKQGNSFENSRFWVFRREGQTCYRCNGKIQRHPYAGQSCYYCATCQSV
jgi:endonuclease-8